MQCRCGEPKAHAIAEVVMGRNLEQTEVELAELPGAPPGLAADALTLAEGMDSEQSLAMKALAARERRETMNRIRELAPPACKEDSVDRIRDDLAKQRAKSTATRKRSRSTKATGRTSP
jgi:hypothetical protein